MANDRSSVRVSHRSLTAKRLLVQPSLYTPRRRLYGKQPLDSIEITRNRNCVGRSCQYSGLLNSIAGIAFLFGWTQSYYRYKMTRSRDFFHLAALFTLSLLDSFLLGGSSATVRNDPIKNSIPPCVRQQYTGIRHKHHIQDISCHKISSVNLYPVNGIEYMRLSSSTSGGFELAIFHVRRVTQVTRALTRSLCTLTLTMVLQIAISQSFSQCPSGSLVQNCPLQLRKDGLRPGHRRQPWSARHAEIWTPHNRC